MQVKQDNCSHGSTQTTGGIKRTLNLTSLTVNAMALIAPGAFLWTTFQLQAAQINGAVSTAGEMWTGLVAALVLAFLTAISYAELSDIYPKAGSGSSYYFAEAALLEKEKAHHRQWRVSPNSSSAGFLIYITGYIRASWWPFPRL